MSTFSPPHSTGGRLVEAAGPAAMGAGSDVLLSIHQLKVVYGGAVIGVGSASLAVRAASAVSAATRKFPETATKLPVGGHEICPLTVMGSARHDVVCLAAFRG